MSLNKVMLIGNVGKEPDVRYIDGGVAVASFPLATSERGYKLQNGTEVPERTEWHNIIMWRGQAEYIEKYVHKGDKLFVEGKIRSRTYDDQNGIKRYITEIFAENFEILSSRNSPTNIQQLSGNQNQSDVQNKMKSSSANANGDNDIDKLPF